DLHGALDNLEEEQAADLDPVVPFITPVYVPLTDQLITGPCADGRRDVEKDIGIVIFRNFERARGVAALWNVLTNVVGSRSRIISGDDDLAGGRQIHLKADHLRLPVDDAKLGDRADAGIEDAVLNQTRVDVAGVKTRARAARTGGERELHAAREAAGVE